MLSFQSSSVYTLSIPMRAVLTVLAVAPLFAAETKLPPLAQVQVDFNKDIQPLLAAKCYACHGSKVQQSGLRLDKRQNALRGGDYGPVILQGKSAESKFIHRLVSGDGGMQMPPTGALETSEISLLRAWIDQGADFGNVEVKEEKPKPVDPQVRELISAIKARNRAAVEKIVKTSPDAAKGVDAGGSTPLHHAAAFATPAIMKVLLDAGADIEAKNRFGQRPLHWAFADAARTALLLERGADVNARANDGRAALHSAASQRQGDAVLRLLLAKGADVNVATSTDRTPLMAAAGTGETGLMRLLLARKADVHKISGTGSTALMDAASSRNLEAVKMLVEVGANVNARTKRNNTALATAAMYGSEDMVKLLLDKGADVNVRDERGYSPLMYAAYSEAQPAGVVKLLLAQGADVNVTGEGETPKSLAAKRGETEVARLLHVAEAERARGGIAAAPKTVSAPRTPAQAVETALAVLAKQSPTFIKKSGCNSCHNQYLPSAAAAMARDRGLKAPAVIEQLGLEQAEKYSERAIDMTVAAVGSIGYEFFDFAANRRAPEPYTDAAVHYLKAMQTADGGWQTTGSRPPLTSDDFITTAMAVNVLRAYTPAAQRNDTEQRLARAAKWLASANASTTQQRSFQLLGLGWAKAAAAVIERSAKPLVDLQRSDGGWAQLPGMGSDAYATGEALYALHTAGKMAVNDPVYQKGVQYLLRTQAEDGSWLVKARSLPTQPYFDPGFPYAEHQFISAAGTSWAAMALTLTVDAPGKMSRRDD